MIVEQRDTNRLRPERIVRRFPIVVVAAILSVGVCCWATFVTKTIFRTASAATSYVVARSIGSHNTKADARPFNLSSDWDTDLTSVEIETENHAAASDVTDRIPGLVLQAVQIGKLRRTALIGDTVVSEDQTANIHGITLHVDSIASTSVQVTIDGKCARLLLDWNDRNEVEVKTDLGQY
jgi:hypothetical protein